MRKAGSEMPSLRKSQSPKKAHEASTTKAIRLARQATCRRWSAEKPWVTPRKIGTRAKGSTITNSVTSALVRNSTVMIAPGQGRGGAFVPFS